MTGRGRRGALARQASRFAAIGVVSTLAYIVLYLALRTVLPAAPANVLALLTTAVANTAANRRITFGIRGLRHGLADHLGGLTGFLLALGITSGSLVALSAVDRSAGRLTVAAVLAAASVVATAARFWVLRATMGCRFAAVPSISVAGRRETARVAGLMPRGHSTARLNGHPQTMSTPAPLETPARQEPRP